MTKIKFKLEGDEPVCTGKDCEHWNSTFGLPPGCQQSRTRPVDTCIPGLRQQRDEARADLAEASKLKTWCPNCGEVPRTPMTDALESDNAALAEKVERLEDRFTAPIVCICGSTRFKQAWISENARLTREGNIVLAVGLWGHHERVFPNVETKERLDDLHKRKIDLCDWVWVLDVGGYIGESTRSEIEYAKKLGRPIRYLSEEFPEYKEPIDLMEFELAEARAVIGSEVAPGDLVVVAHWSDFDINDATVLGVLSEIKRGHFYIDGSSRGWRHCKLVKSNTLAPATEDKDGV